MKINYPQAIIGVCYAVVFRSLFPSLFKFFDIKQPLTRGQFIVWGLYLLIPPVVLAVSDKIRVVLAPKEHEHVLRDQVFDLQILIAETMAWAIPNAVAGGLYALGFIVIDILIWYLQDIEPLKEIALMLGLPV